MSTPKQLTIKGKEGKEGQESEKVNLVGWARVPRLVASPSSLSYLAEEGGGERTHDCAGQLWTSDAWGPLNPTRSLHIC